MTVSALRAKCHAGAGRLERRVRQHCLWRTKPVREGDAHKRCRCPMAADAPARRVGARDAQPAAIASGERKQGLPSGGGTND